LFPVCGDTGRVGFGDVLQLRVGVDDGLDVLGFGERVEDGFGDLDLVGIGVNGLDAFCRLPRIRGIGDDNSVAVPQQGEFFIELSLPVHVGFLLIGMYFKSPTGRDSNWVRQRDQ